MTLVNERDVPVDSTPAHYLDLAQRSLNPLDVCPANVWAYEQNKPTLVARDLEAHGVPRDVTYAVLMARGVFKWLAVRRDLIRLKHDLRKRTTRTLGAIRIAKRQDDFKNVLWLRGYLAALEETRSEIRALCHSERWRAPNHDPEAVRYCASADQNGDTA